MEDQNDYLLGKSLSVNSKDIANRYAHETRRYANEASVIANTYDTETSNNSDNFNTTASNIDRTYSTDMSNNSDNYNTTAQNISRTYNTDMANNTDTFNTTKTNIQRMYDTEITNANHTRAVSEQNAQNTYDIALKKLENNTISTRHNQESEIKTTKLDPLEEYGEFSGDNFNFVENGYSGVSVKIFTVSKAQAARAAATFNRYGYRVGSGVVVENLKRYSLFSSHTYWQASECYGVIDGNETAASFMRNIFNNGVTVWTDPTRIYNYSHNERIENAL